MNLGLPQSYRRGQTPRRGRPPWPHSPGSQGFRRQGVVPIDQLSEHLAQQECRSPSGTATLKTRSRAIHLGGLPKEPKIHLQRSKRRKPHHLCGEQRKCRAPWPWHVGCLRILSRNKCTLPPRGNSRHGTPCKMLPNHLGCRFYLRSNAGRVSRSPCLPSFQASAELLISVFCNLQKRG